MPTQEYKLLDQGQVEKTVRQSNVVVNAAGTSYTSRHFNMELVNVYGARIVARAAAEAGATRLIHISALGANPDSPSEFLRTKGLGEVAVREEFPSATIIRPANLFGADDRFIARIADALAVPGPFPLPNMGTAIKTPVYAGDVAQGIVATLSEPEAVGATYELVGPREYTMAQLVEYVGETTRKPAWTVPVPDLAQPVLEVAASIAEMPRLKVLPNKEELFRYSFDDEPTAAASTFADLGIEPVTLESEALNILRKYRSSIYHDDILEEDKPKARVV